MKISETACGLGFPLMVKPALEGSSIGMSRARMIVDQLRSAWAKAAEYQSHVMAECWVTGSEYTAAILGREALPLIRLETTHAFYDYDAKYVADDTPVSRSPVAWTGNESALQALAIRTFDAVGASGWGRVDILMDEAQRPWVIEVNTVPGMTGLQSGADGGQRRSASISTSWSGASSRRHWRRADGQCIHQAPEHGQARSSRHGAGWPRSSARLRWPPQRPWASLPIATCHSPDACHCG